MLEAGRPYTSRPAEASRKRGSVKGIWPVWPAGTAQAADWLRLGPRLGPRLAEAGRGWPKLGAA
eukprot:scaffold3205_cov62-Phaeocystis_antarctica.AAC.2